MKLFLILAFFLSFINVAYAYDCGDDTVESLFDEAERSFLMHVTGTKLDEELAKKLTEGDSDELLDNEAIKPIFIDYEIVEEYKGDPDFKPKLFDVVGIGIGFVGMIPGSYYAVLLPGMNEEDDRPLMKNIRRVDICNTPYQHYRFKVDPFQEKLDTLRALRDKTKKEVIVP